MADIQKEKLPPSGIQTILGDVNALSELNNLFRGTKGETTTTSSSLAPGGMEALMRQALEDINGLAAVSSGQRRAGLYNSTTNQLLTNDFLTRTAGEIARSTATKTEQKSTPRQLDPMELLLASAALQGAKKIDFSALGDKVSKFFGGSDLDASSGYGYEMASAYPDDSFMDFGAEDLGIDYLPELDFGMDWDASFSDEFVDDFFIDYADFGHGYKNGGRVMKKNYADGGRALPSVYGIPDSSLSLNRRGIVNLRPQRTPISPVRNRPVQAGDREPVPDAFLDQNQLLGTKLLLVGSKIGNTPIGAPISGLNRMTRGRPEDLEEGAGQAIGATVGATLGSVAGPVGTVLGSQVGGKFGEDVIGGVIGGLSQAAEDIPDFAVDLGNKLTGSSGVTAFSPFAGSSFAGLFANGGAVVPGYDRKGKDKVNINVSGGEFIVPTDVVDALGPEFFEQIVAMFHKPIRGGK